MADDKYKLWRDDFFLLRNEGFSRDTLARCTVLMGYAEDLFVKLGFPSERRADALVWLTNDILNKARSKALTGLPRESRRDNPDLDLAGLSAFFRMDSDSDFETLLTHRTGHDRKLFYEKAASLGPDSFSTLELRAGLWADRGVSRNNAQRKAPKWLFTLAEAMRSHLNDQEVLTALRQHLTDLDSASNQEVDNQAAAVSKDEPATYIQRPSHTSHNVLRTTLPSRKTVTSVMAAVLILALVMLSGDVFRPDAAQPQVSSLEFIGGSPPERALTPDGEAYTWTLMTLDPTAPIGTNSNPLTPSGEGHDDWSKLEASYRPVTAVPSATHLETVLKVEPNPDDRCSGAVTIAIEVNGSVAFKGDMPFKFKGEEALLNGGWPFDSADKPVSVPTPRSVDRVVVRAQLVTDKPCQVRLALHSPRLVTK